jgi:hypothetical protein
MKLSLCLLLASGSSVAADAPFWTKWVPGFGAANSSVAGAEGAAAAEPGWAKFVPGMQHPAAAVRAVDNATDAAMSEAATEPAWHSFIPSMLPGSNATVSDGDAGAGAADAMADAVSGAADAIADSSTQGSNNAPLSGLSAVVLQAHAAAEPAQGKSAAGAPTPPLPIAPPVVPPPPPSRIAPPPPPSLVAAGGTSVAAGQGEGTSATPGMGAVPGLGGKGTDKAAGHKAAPTAESPTPATALGSAPSLLGSYVDAPWAKFIPGGAAKSPASAPPSAPVPAAADKPASDAKPADAPWGKWMPFKPEPRPARHMPTTVLGSWASPELNESVMLNATFVLDDVFMAGFMASVQVEPWTAGALIALNFTDTDVVIQRLFNGDIVDEHGDRVPEFALLTGKTGQLYNVRLHNTSVHSAAKTPLDSFTFMASGTAQAPEMTIGPDWVDADVLAPAGSGDVLRYHASAYSFPGGYVASIEVRPWAVGERVTVDFSGTDTVVTGWHNARLVSEHKGVYTVELTEFTLSDAELTPDSSIVIKATGSADARPKLSKAPASADPLRLLALSRIGSSTAASGVRALPVLALAFAAGMASVGVLVAARRASSARARGRGDWRIVGRHADGSLRAAMLQHEDCAAPEAAYLRA